MTTLLWKRALVLVQLAALSFGSGAYARPLDLRHRGQLEASSSVLPQEGALRSVLSDPTMAKRLYVPGVRNVGQVTPTLYRGGQANEEGWQNLAKMGVDIVVDLRVTREGHEREQVTKAGMRFVSIPWECFNPNDNNVVRFLEVLRENPGKKVFVHCYTGDDRTGLEIAAYRMAEQGWTSKKARDEMQAFGFNFFHRRICPRMGAYETHFPERFAKDEAFARFRGDLTSPDPAPSR
jgi:protein tyrosine phosphatase (PTP) superfamily phosphohydrolase (DUF442 family)